MIRRVPWPSLVCLFLVLNAVSAPLSNAAGAEVDLDLYDRLLDRHTREVDDVVGTRVDYRAIAGSAEWKTLSAQLRAERPSRLGREEQLAFWINAYNVFTIDLIVEHYPVESIRDIGSFLFPVWDQDVAIVEGREVSLGDIEHEILRKMGEPRIHAAIVCASTSCPPLARTAFRAERLDAQLDAAMRRWLASPEKGVAIDRAGRSVRVSAIFDWFEEDFEAGGGVLATIARHVSTDDATWLRGPGREARIRHLDYDWTLNDVR
ncbi:MAG: DUF547 domain-containing protein [bacterium]|nr:DUF547 domain-containing protein [bacterium]